MPTAQEVLDYLEKSGRSGTLVEFDVNRIAEWIIAAGFKRIRGVTDHLDDPRWVLLKKKLQLAGKAVVVARPAVPVSFWTELLVLAIHCNPFVPSRLDAIQILLVKEET